MWQHNAVVCIDSWPKFSDAGNAPANLLAWRGGTLELNAHALLRMMRAAF